VSHQGEAKNAKTGRGRGYTALNTKEGDRVGNFKEGGKADPDYKSIKKNDTNEAASLRAKKICT